MPAVTNLLIGIKNGMPMLSKNAAMDKQGHVCCNKLVAMDKQGHAQYIKM